jgi:hypothetical protein
MAAGKALERRISKLSKSFASLRLERQLRELIPIIRRPGWTTPAELKLVLSLVDALDNQINVLGQLGDALLIGSKTVGR